MWVGVWLVVWRGRGGKRERERGGGGLTVSNFDLI